MVSLVSHELTYPKSWELKLDRAAAGLLDFLSHCIDFQKPQDFETGY